MKKSLFTMNTTPQKASIDAYVQELEDSLDIILNLRPALLKSGIYQTLNQKVKLLLKNVALFSGVYLGKLYCLEVVGFLLREVLEVKFGMKVNDVDNILNQNIESSTTDMKQKQKTNKIKEKQQQEVIRAGLPNKFSSNSSSIFSYFLRYIPKKLILNLLDDLGLNQFYGKSLDILEKTLQTMKRKKTNYKDVLEKEQLIRDQIKQNLYDRKEGETFSPGGKGQNEPSSNRGNLELNDLTDEQMMEMFGESRDNSNNNSPAKSQNNSMSVIESVRFEDLDQQEQQINQSTNNQEFSGLDTLAGNSFKEFEVSKYMDTGYNGKFKRSDSKNLISSNGGNILNSSLMQQHMTSTNQIAQNEAMNQSQIFFQSFQGDPEASIGVDKRQSITRFEVAKKDSKPDQNKMEALVKTVQKNKIERKKTFADQKKTIVGR